MSAPTYTNGYIPASLLITFNVGYSAGEGQWKHQLSPGTYSKHLALVALARKNTGRTLAISAGWGAYRPYAAQVYARQVHGNGAATPGTSSHGGFWERQQTLAIDYGNWSYVYNGSRDAFYRDARAVGFEPGLISPQRGYPDEPWHVVDKNPWAGGSAAGGSTGDDVMNADQEGLLVNVGKIVTELRNMLVDPSTGLWKVAVPQAIAAGNAAKASADNGANIAAEIRNLIVDPRTGVLAAISRISTGDIDESALAKSLAETLSARLGPEVAAAVLDGAAQRLIR